ncbi:histidine phosphatase family protein [Nitratireductor sp. StC3]|uniref:histidine phosphatase family protein n=1 Tax=Nitratireductor sp. StC3 TaxID=2126741 RepID=UPI000D0DE9CF|nr:histidine phosphatase family protein [Nitratireductor sp. StC3]PSM17938.1 histidine phosphatase family protein [Nitratireductor sp. StC3]
MIRILITLALISLTLPAQATEAGWALLRGGGHVVLMRHAYALGTVEPPNFDIEKCGTQRNLSERGRHQARRIGSLIAARGAPVERVLSSRLCRALETARLAFGAGAVEAFAPLDPPGEDETANAEALAATIEAVHGYSGSGNMVMVADLPAIKALTGHKTREGEALIVAPDENGLVVLGRIVFN